MKEISTHNPVRRDEHGEYALHLCCPDCEATGRTLTQEETRQALLLFEEQLASWGYALSDVFEGDTLDTVNMILRGNR